MSLLRLSRPVATVAWALSVLVLAGCTANPAPPATADTPQPPVSAPAPSQAKPAEAPTKPSDKVGLAVGYRAPNIVVHSVYDGQEIQLTQLKGKVVLLNFWATTCPPCKAEMPDLERLHQEHGDELVVLAVGREQPQKMIDFAKEMNLTFPIAYDYGQSAGTYRIMGVPTSYFVDQNGIIRGIKYGAMTLETMQEQFAIARQAGANP